MWIIPPQRLSLLCRVEGWAGMSRGCSCSGGQTFFATPGTSTPQLTAPMGRDHSRGCCGTAWLSPRCLVAPCPSGEQSHSPEGREVPVPGGHSELEAPLGLVGDGGGDGEGRGGGGRGGVPDVQDPAPHGPRASIEHKVIHQIPITVQSLSSHARGTPAKARRSWPAEGKCCAEPGNQFP